jgi:voltage-gated sodium channel
VIAPTAAEHPWSYVFFVLYIVLATYIVLNLFIAVAVEALENEADEEREELRHEVDEVEQAVDESAEAILAALADLKSQVSALEARLPER